MACSFCTCLRPDIAAIVRHLRWGVPGSFTIRRQARRSDTPTRLFPRFHTNAVRAFLWRKFLGLACHRLFDRSAMPSKRNFPSCDPLKWACLNGLHRVRLSRRSSGRCSTGMGRGSFASTGRQYEQILFHSQGLRSSRQRHGRFTYRRRSTRSNTFITGISMMRRAISGVSASRRSSILLKVITR